MSHALALPGIDGANPLGFLAALGVLNALADRDSGESPPALQWRNQGSWIPVLHGTTVPQTCEGLVRILRDDLDRMASEPALQLQYEKDGRRMRDLKPTPSLFRGYLEQLAASASPVNRRSVDLAAAFATDVATDLQGNTKPTFLHFTAGQQQFLQMVDELIRGVTDDDLLEAVQGPWGYSRPLPVLQWDCTAFRDYALRASDPSGDKKQGVPGAEYLALRGLSFLRVAPRGEKIFTTGCFGEWKTGRFRWPLWSVPLSRATTQSLVQFREVERMSEAERHARGVALVLESQVKRSDQGGYGSFSPPSVV